MSEQKAQTINKGNATLFHQTGRPYVSISNAVIESIRNPDALAIWTFLQSKDNHWNVIAGFLQQHFGIGRNRYQEAMKHLRRMGLITIENLRDPETGLAQGRRVIVNYEPVKTEHTGNVHIGTKPNIQETDNSENRTFGKRPTTNKGCSTNKESFTNNSMSGEPDDLPEETKKIDPLGDTWKDVLAYLNEVTKSRFEAVDTNKELINARLKQGATLEQMKAVIDYKAAEWLGTDSAKYLRPATLFNKTKYSQYVGVLHLPVPKPKEPQPQQGRAANFSEAMNHIHQRVSEFQNTGFLDHD